MEGALESAAASAAAEPVDTPTSTDSSAASATTTPVESGAAAVSANTAKPGPIPYERFTEVNNKAKSLEAKLQALAWAEGVDPSRLTEVANWYQRATSNPAEFIAEYLGNVPAEHAAAVRSQAAKLLAAARGVQTGDDEITPDVGVYDAQGQLVGRTYSDKALKALQDRQGTALEQKVQQMLAPLMRTTQTLAEERQHTQRVMEAQSFSQAEVTAAKAWPHFETYKSDIAQLYAQAPQPDPRWTDREKAQFERAQLREAYITVLSDKLPGLTAQTAATAQSSVLADLNKRANARTEHPGAAAATTSTRPKNAKELSALLEQLSGGR